MHIKPCRIPGAMAPRFGLELTKPVEVKPNQDIEIHLKATAADIEKIGLPHDMLVPDQEIRILLANRYGKDLVWVRQRKGYLVPEAGYKVLPRPTASTRYAVIEDVFPQSRFRPGKGPWGVFSPVGLLVQSAHRYGEMQKLFAALPEALDPWKERLNTGLKNTLNWRPPTLLEKLRHTLRQWRIWPKSTG